MQGIAFDGQTQRWMTLQKMVERRAPQSVSTHPVVDTAALAVGGVCERGTKTLGGIPAGIMS